MVTLDQGGRGIRWQQFVKPAPDLRPFVEYLWVQSRPPKLQCPAFWRIVPDLNPHLLVHRDRDGWSAPRLVGSRAVFVDVPVVCRDLTVGCRLRPGALMALYGMCASELTDRAVYLRNVTNRPFVVENDSAEAVIEAFERELVQASRGLEIDPRASRFANAVSHPQVRVTTMANDLGCSERSLRRFADTHIGLAPKPAARVARLLKVLATSLPRSTPHWSSLALAAGYADQAHLIRDARELLGETPVQYWARGR